MPINIMAPLGQRGPYEIEIPFSVSQDEQVFIQIYDQSARDGGMTHLASVGVMLSASGPENITPWHSDPEQIVITVPSPGERLSGGVAHIEGIGVASFEGTFVLEIVDANGVVVGSQAVITSAPDMGLPGAFSADVAYASLNWAPDASSFAIQARPLGVTSTWRVLRFNWSLDARSGDVITDGRD